jgi:hypothetical protein
MLRCRALDHANMDFRIPQFMHRRLVTPRLFGRR